MKTKNFPHPNFRPEAEKTLTCFAWLPKIVENKIIWLKLYDEVYCYGEYYETDNYNTRIGWYKVRNQFIKK